MQRLVGFENAKVMTGESTQLPKGGYIVKIMDCQEISGEKNGKRYSYLAFSFDVCEGEYKNHFTNLYTASTDENKKWRGVLNVFVPQEGDVYYEDNLSRFKTMTANFEESNKGYAWNWDEKTLKNKVIGIISFSSIIIEKEINPLFLICNCATQFLVILNFKSNSNILNIF